jgi:hypothetical protein
MSDNKKRRGRPRFDRVPVRKRSYFVTDELHENLVALAAEKGIKLNAFVRYLLTRGLQEEIEQMKSENMNKQRVVRIFYEVVNAAGYGAEVSQKGWKDFSSYYFRGESLVSPIRNLDGTYSSKNTGSRYITPEGVIRGDANYFLSSHEFSLYLQRGKRP